MYMVSNQANCEGLEASPANSNMVVYYSIEFSLFKGGHMSWHTPLDLGWGGFILVDGV